MPKKIHGKGGKTGHQSKETRDRVEKMYGGKEKNQRAHAKRERRQQRKIDVVAKEIKEEIKPVAEQAYKNALTKLRQKGGAKPTALIKALAIDGWYIDQIMKSLEKKKVFKEQVTEKDLEQMHFMSGEERVKAYEHLLNKGRNPKQLKTEIEKWKRRVPGIAKGHY